MPDPLNYASSKGYGEKPIYAIPVQAARDPLPVDFDSEVMRSQDHAVVAAIEMALRKARIGVLRRDSREPAGREVALIVRAIDLNNAQLIAARMFVARAKLRKK